MKEEALLKKLRAAFRVEAEERLTSISSKLIELENTSDEGEQGSIIEVVYREAHSLKGAARAVELADIEVLCQSIEDIFADMKRKRIVVSPELFDALLDSVRFLENRANILEWDQPTSCQDELATLVRRLTSQAAAGEDSETRTKDPEADTGAIGLMRDKKTDAKGTERSLPTPLTKPARGDKPSPEAQPVVRTTTETVRMSTEKLSSLLCKAEELVSLKLVAGQHLSDLRDILRSFREWQKRQAGINADIRLLRNMVQRGKPANGTCFNLAPLANVLEFLDWNQDNMQALRRELRILTNAAAQNGYLLGRMVDDLLDSAKETTMLPFSTLLELLPRMVRDLARDLGKEVDLKIQGSEIQIDRRILEEMKDPFIHLLRNAVDHGLEKPEKREKQGKPRRGIVRFIVSQTEGDRVEVLVSDDGRGIDPDQIKDIAIGNELLTKGEAERLDEQEVLSLIFRSGVSTSPIVTQLSGRGLGLAIVQERIEKLNGLMAVETRIGMGSSFRIQLPVTLATYRGILVRVGDDLFILPSSHVERVASIPREDVQTIENRATIPLDGRAVSLVHLADSLELPRARNVEEGNGNITVAVLGSGERRIAFQISEVLSEQEVLAKDLGRQLRRVRNIAGATILGSGRVAPILNVRDLLESAAKASAQGSMAAVPEDETASRSKSILVVEDSITSRMLLKNILETAGYVVKTAFDGMDAYATLRIQDFDMIVTDIQMPRMDGFELTAKIRGDERLREKPVVLVTGLESREDRERGIDVGANAYIVKSSFDQANLLEVVMRLI